MRRGSALVLRRRILAFSGNPPTNRNRPLLTNGDYTLRWITSYLPTNRDLQTLRKGLTLIDYTLSQGHAMNRRKLMKQGLAAGMAVSGRFCLNGGIAFAETHN